MPNIATSELFFLLATHSVPTADFLGASSSGLKRQASELPEPPKQPKRLVVPDVGPSSSAVDVSSSRIYYPSQDPHRLGAKGDVIE